MRFLRGIGSVIVFLFSFVTKYFKTFVFLAIVLGIWAISREEKVHVQDPDSVNLAEIRLTDEITTETRTEIFDKIEELSKLKNLKGVLLFISSPGGNAGASTDIAEMVDQLNQKIPVVAYADDVMASGSYSFGMNTAKIIANRGAIIGSIGVILPSYNIEELMKKIGVEDDTIAAGEYKRALSPFTRKRTPNEKKFVEKFLRTHYEAFIEAVAKARNLDPKNYKIFAEGKIFTADEARDIGLVDDIGGYLYAKKELQMMAKVKDPVWYEWDEVTHDESALEKIIRILIDEGKREARALFKRL